MKKTRLMLGFLVVAAALMGLTGCLIQDYQLDYTTEMYSNTTNSATVDYTIYNSGYRDLQNVSVRIQVAAFSTSLNDYEYGTGWTTATNINSAMTSSGRITVSLPYHTDYTAFTSEVIATAWDVE